MYYVTKYLKLTVAYRSAYCAWIIKRLSNDWEHLKLTKNSPMTLKTNTFENEFTCNVTILFIWPVSTNFKNALDKSCL